MTPISIYIMVTSMGDSRIDAGSLASMEMVYTSIYIHGLIVCGLKKTNTNNYKHIVLCIYFKVNTWICLRCLERKFKNILPNGGLLVIYHGTK